MRTELQEMLKEARETLQSMDESSELEELRLRLLGKKGRLTALLRRMGELAAEERPQAGKLVNEVRDELERLIEEKRVELKQRELQRAMARDRADVTWPGRVRDTGTLHPLTITYNRVRDIFVGMGFEVMRGREIETDEYNFAMLNIPPGHPARDTQDTFYVNDEYLLRTHTSPGQVHVMQHSKPPIRIIIPGKVYRVDDVDATHSPIFHQIEGLYVNERVTMGDLKGVLDVFIKRLYGEGTKTRFRPGYFPFTEPSAEVDATCSQCNGAGCRVCKGTGWIEILGCGMVHPQVLENSGIDSTRYTGYAFGLGLDRIANIKYGITDIRNLFENDMRFLEQFKGAY